VSALSLKSTRAPLFPLDGTAQISAPRTHTRERAIKVTQDCSHQYSWLLQGPRCSVTCSCPWPCLRPVPLFLSSDAVSALFLVSGWNNIGGRCSPSHIGSQEGLRKTLPSTVCLLLGTVPHSREAVTPTFCGNARSPWLTSSGPASLALI